MPDTPESGYRLNITGILFALHEPGNNQRYCLDHSAVCVITVQVAGVIDAIETCVKDVVSRHAGFDASMFGCDVTVTSGQSDGPSEDL